MGESVGGGGMRKGVGPDGRLQRRDQALPRGVVNLDQQVNGGVKRQKVRAFTRLLSRAVERVFGKVETTPEVDGVTPYIEDMRERHDAKMGRDANAGFDIGQSRDLPAPDDLATVVGDPAEPVKPQIFVHTVADRRRNVLEHPRTRQHGTVTKDIKQTREPGTTGDEPAVDVASPIEITPELAAARQPTLKVVKNDKSS